MKTWRSNASLRSLRCLLAATALALAGAAPAWALDLTELMGLLAKRTSGEAKFTEERTVSGFDAPLRASGLLTFAAPDSFARFTLQPRAESMEVRGNTLLLKRGGRTRQMALDAVPELAALADAMRGTLNGDAQLLQRSFKVAVAGERARWTMTLVPLDSRLAGQVRNIEIGGQVGDVRSIELQLVGGDRSLMWIDPPTALTPKPTP